MRMPAGLKEIRVPCTPGRKDKNTADMNISENKEECSRESTIGSLYKRLWFSIISIFVMLAMLVGSTYAWFNSAVTTDGNMVKSGVMAIELIMSEDALKAKLAEKEKKSIEEVVIPAGYKEYFRQIDEMKHYIVTDTETALITFKNVEPGQVYPVTVKVANVGQLAFTYMPTFEIEKETGADPATGGQTEKALSLTGLETLEREKADSEEFLGHVFTEGVYTDDGTLAGKGLLTNREYEVRYKVLRNEQWNKEEDKDGGGHLEDVLKVYHGTCEADIKDENYIGTVSDILNKTVEEKYKGYLLPYSEVADAIPNGGKKVEISNGTDVIETITHVMEYDELNFIIKMPEEADSLYENASLVLRAGAKATQVEYEKDGRDIMIYDADAANRLVDPVRKGDIIKLNDGNDYLVLKRTGNGALVLGTSTATYQEGWDTAAYLVSGTTEFEPLQAGPGNAVGTKYEGSLIDSYLENEWYGILSGNYPAMAAAIRPVTITQGLYARKDDSLDGGSVLRGTYPLSNGEVYNYRFMGGYKNVTVGERHVYALDLSDIAEYLGRYNLSKATVDKMFPGVNALSESVFLRSTSDMPSSIFCIGSESGDINYVAAYGVGRGIRPAFVIDLTAPGVQFEVQVE